MQVIRATVKTETASNLFKDGRNTVFGVYLFMELNVPSVLPSPTHSLK
jgi:hypothetical protein